MIGGIANLVHGEPRLTAEIDLVLAVDVECALDLLAHLSQEQFSPLFEDIEEVVRTAFILPML